ncbi:ganglioside GM2 activator-like [Leucoraja erinacea]|uniref:ganglioside GM2 activator-like n=1 Tax=Leucoraja erinaceus TaxID=7782 RepID=UPI002454CD38|nr:ganglioside GM2 activator-like [Leucoraja erinacea]
MALSFEVLLLPLFVFHQLSSSDGLSWRNCRGGEEPVTLKNMTVQPDPIKIPGQILLEGTAYVAESLTLLKAEVTIHKKLLFWWKLPCGDSECTFDLCKPLHLGPSCAVSSGFLYFPPTKFNIPKQLISTYWASGQYKATIDLKSPKANVGCIELYFSIEQDEQ